MEQSPTKLSFDFDDVIDLNRPFSSGEFKAILDAESNSLDSSIDGKGFESHSDEISESNQRQVFSQINYGMQFRWQFRILNF
jgi:hypothetical protein